jgi:hypothetical protein
MACGIQYPPNFSLKDKPADKMGNQPTKPSTPTNRLERANVRAQAILRTEATVRQVREQAVAATEKPSSSNSQSQSLVVVNATPISADVVIVAADVALNQLKRHGREFTKTDLIALLVVIDPLYHSKIDLLRESTCEDLRTKIRTLIYDPARLASGINSLPPVYEE